MASANLTKRSVDALEFSIDCDYFVWDTKLKGFGIRVTERTDAAGNAHRRKMFVIAYRPIGSRQMRRLNLGSFGKLTTEEARIQALRQLSAISSGSDPVAERRAQSKSQTVKDAGELYLREVDRRRKPTTAREYRRLWGKHVVPSLGAKPASVVTNSEIRKLHRSLDETPYVANRVVALLAAFFAYLIAEPEFKLKDNPAIGIEFYPEHGRERFLTRQEFGRLGAALLAAETVGLPAAPALKRRPKKVEDQKHRPKSAEIPKIANPFAVAAIRLLALTGCRENEILSLRWDAVDLERGYIRLQDSKTGKSVRPLSRSAAAILEALPRIEGNPFVVVGSQPGSHLTEVKRTWHAVRHHAKLLNLRLHDLRHSFASVPAGTGESLLVVKALLGHKNIATTERYAHLGDDPVRKAADRAAESIADWLAGPTEENRASKN